MTWTLVIVSYVITALAVSIFLGKALKDESKQG